MITVLEINGRKMSGESTNIWNLNYKHENISLVRGCVSIEITKIFIWIKVKMHHIKIWKKHVSNI